MISTCFFSPPRYVRPCHKSPSQEMLDQFHGKAVEGEHFMMETNNNNNDDIDMSKDYVRPPPTIEKLFDDKIAASDSKATTRTNYSGASTATPPTAVDDLTNSRAFSDYSPPSIRGGHGSGSQPIGKRKIFMGRSTIRYRGTTRRAGGCHVSTTERRTHDSGSDPALFQRVLGRAEARVRLLVLNVLFCLGGLRCDDVVQNVW